MADKILPNENDKAMAKQGIMFQYESMFDEDTRAKFSEMGIDKFIERVIMLRSSELAKVRTLSNILHPRG